MRARVCLGVVLLLSAAAPAAGQVECVDHVYAVAGDNTIRIFHDGATYNCCPVFDYALSSAVDRIVVHEYEIEALCDCICCMDLDVTVADVPPGDYIVEFHWFEYESGEWVLVELEVTVGGSGQGGVPGIEAFAHSDCYDPATAVREDPGLSWTMLKSRYR